VWKVSEETKIWFGEDANMGYDHDIFLIEYLVQHLRGHGLNKINWIVDVDWIDIWQQGWLFDTSIVLDIDGVVY